MKLLRQSASGFSKGMNDTASVADDFRRDECALMMNVRPGRDGSAKWLDADTTVGGSADYSAANEMQVFAYESGTTDLVRAFGNNVQVSTDRGLNYTTVFAGAAGGGFWDTAMWRQGGVNYLLMVNGTHAKSWNGAVLADIAGIPAGAKYITVANERVWVAGHTAGTNRVRASAIADFADWGATNGLDLGVGIRTAVALGTIGSRVIVFGRNYTAYVEGFGQAEVVVAQGSRGISEEIGCRSFRTLVAVPNGLCFQSNRGMEFCDGEKIVPIGQNLSTLMGLIDLAEAQRLRFHGFYHEDEDEYWLRLVLAFVPVPGSGALADPAYQGQTVASKAVTATVNLSTGACWIRHATPLGQLGITSFARGPVPTTLAPTAGVGQKVHACHDGKMLILELRPDLARNDGVLIGPLWDFGKAGIQKRARLMRVLLKQTGPQGPSAPPGIGAGSLYLRVRADDEALPGINFATPDAYPRVSAGVVPYLLRVSRRGVNLQVQVEAVTAPGVRVTGLEMEAEVLEGIR